MATLKEHQNAMVDLLANGSAIPASATRLAHALHDVLGLLLERDSEPHSSSGAECGDATPPRAFINDVRLAADLSAVPPRGSELIANLRAELANVTTQRNTYKARCESLEAEIVEPKSIGELRGEIEKLKAENKRLSELLEDAEEKLGY